MEQHHRLAPAHYLIMDDPLFGDNGAQSLSLIRTGGMGDA